VQATCEGLAAVYAGHVEPCGGHGPGFLALVESAQLPYSVSSWFAGFSAFLGLFGGVPDGGLLRAAAPVRLDVKCTLAKFDSWFYGCWNDLPVDPRTASTATVACCKYQQWFAVPGGSEPLGCEGGYGPGRWKGGPRYVRRTAGMCTSKVRALSAFRLAAHDLEVETGKCCRVRDAATGRMRPEPVPRDRRMCGFCWGVVGDEMRGTAHGLQLPLICRSTGTLKLVPHEPCWLLSGVSRCEGLDHVTVTVTVTVSSQTQIHGIKTPHKRVMHSAKPWQVISVAHILS
jgi:hypothetical protein